MKAGLYGIAGIAGVLTLLKFFHTKSTATPIVTYPNPILRRIANPVDVIDDDVMSLAQ